MRQTILAIGIQDIDPLGLIAPAGVEILGASSDHLIVESANDILCVGQEIRFQMNYGALLRAMTSSFVSKSYAQLKTAQASVTSADPGLTTNCCKEHING